MTPTQQLIDKAIKSLNEMEDSAYKRILIKTMPTMLEAFTHEISNSHGQQMLDLVDQYPRVLAYYMKTARASFLSTASAELAQVIEDMMQDAFADAMETASKIIGSVRHV